MCEAFGATLTLNRNKLSINERREVVLEATHGLGVDVAFEMAGELDAMTESISLVRTGGACVSAGFAEPRGRMEIDPFLDIGRKHLRVQGVWVSDVRHTHMALQLILSRMEDFKKLVTHRFPLDRANDAIRAMKTREAVKAVLLPHGETGSSKLETRNSNS